jgi:1-deoxy-D-xylulose 5-phosphate reductoisomerase
MMAGCCERKISILGATGSVGKSTLDLSSARPTGSKSSR